MNLKPPKVVDDTPFSIYTDLDSEGNAMLKSHAYKATTDGFVSADCLITDSGNIISGYVGFTSNPLVDGIQIGAQEADAANSWKSIFFAVAKDEYFEIRVNTDTPTIYWKSKGVLGNPVDYN